MELIFIGIGIVIGILLNMLINYMVKRHTEKRNYSRFLEKLASEARRDYFDSIVGYNLDGYGTR
jgi:hypothetical protein